MDGGKEAVVQLLAAAAAHGQEHIIGCIVGTYSNVEDIERVLVGSASESSSVRIVP